MAFITINDGFTCLYCGTENPPANKTCRNHCKKCLHSLHVDEVFPGDRKSNCHGDMIPIDILPHAKHGLVIVHQCTKCKNTIQNKKADDDDMETIYEIMRKNAESRV